jgi:hypothetical protein
LRQFQPFYPIQPTQPGDATELGGAHDSTIDRALEGPEITGQYDDEID